METAVLNALISTKDKEMCIRDRTKAAVAKFQTVVGLESTGVYDNTTRSKLEASDAPSNPEAAVIKKGDAGEEVTELQNRLILLRYMICLFYTSRCV